jgi:GntR family transcriptional regulator
MNLNNQSPIPLYIQLAQRLRSGIESGVYAVDEKIPSENILADQFSIGRPTVRQATDLLVREGLLQRRRGSGTYVLPPPQKIDLFSLTGTTAALQKSKVASETQLLCKPVLLSGEEVSTQSQLPAVLAQRELYTLQRLTSINGKAALLEHMYLVADVFQGIERLDLENQSLSRVVSDEFHLHATAADQSFDICYPELKVAQSLELDSAQPALHVSRLLHFGDLEGAIYCDIYCRTDRFQFSQNITVTE